MSCEIVENMASFKTFWYCRTHKCESKDCPKETPPASAIYRGLLGAQISWEEIAKLHPDVNIITGALTGDTVYVRNSDGSIR